MMENFTFQALQAYNYWYPPSRVGKQSIGFLPCGHKGIIGAPMCKKCADTLLDQSLMNEEQYRKLIDDLVTSYVKEDREGTPSREISVLPNMSPLPIFAEEFLSHLGVTNHSVGTQVGYADVLGLFFAYLSPDPANYTLEEFAKITHRNIESFLHHCQADRKNGPASLAHKQSAIKSLYRYLVREDMLQIDVTAKLDAINVREKMPKALDPDQVAALSKKLDSDEGFKWTKNRDRAIIFTLIGTGLRVSELSHLDVSDIDFGHGVLRILGKDGDEAYAPFGDDVAQGLRNYITLERPRYEIKQHSPALFLSIRGSRISVDAVQTLVVGTLESIGVYGFSPQKLRSTAATLLLRETDDLGLVQNFLRHKDPKTTRRYSLILQDELMQAVKQIHLK